MDQLDRTGQLVGKDGEENRVTRGLEALKDFGYVILLY